MIVGDTTAPGALAEEEAARYCGTPRNTFRRIAQSGVIPRVRLGNRWVYRIASLDNFLASRETRNTAAAREVSHAGQ